MQISDHKTKINRIIEWRYIYKNVVNIITKIERVHLKCYFLRSPPDLGLAVFPGKATEGRPQQIDGERHGHGYAHPVPGIPPPQLTVHLLRLHPEQHAGSVQILGLVNQQLEALTATGELLWGENALQIGRGKTLSHLSTIAMKNVN